MLEKLIGLRGVMAACCLILALSPSMALARPLHMREFDSRYLQPGSKLAEAAKGRVHCYFCHANADKPRYTDFGKAIRKALGTNVKDIDAIKAALDRAVQEVAHEKEAEPVTYADLIEAGTLPLH